MTNLDIVFGLPKNSYDMYVFKDSRESGAAICSFYDVETDDLILTGEFYLTTNGKDGVVETYANCGHDILVLAFSPRKLFYLCREPMRKVEDNPRVADQDVFRQVMISSKAIKDKVVPRPIPEEAWQMESELYQRLRREKNAHRLKQAGLLLLLAGAVGAWFWFVFIL